MMTAGLTIHSDELLYKGWSELHRIQYEWQPADGNGVSASQEVFDCGDAVGILLYNPEQQSIILTRQFRLAAMLNGHTEGRMTEVCAGKIEDKSPGETVRLELLEETGYEVSAIRKVMSVYVSPGAVKELVHLYVAPYTNRMKKGEGGGLLSENEHIEVLEIPFAKAIHMITTGEINDAKTIILIQYAQLTKLL